MAITKDSVLQIQAERKRVEEEKKKPTEEDYRRMERIETRIDSGLIANDLRFEIATYNGTFHGDDFLKPGLIDEFVDKYRKAGWLVIMSPVEYIGIMLEFK